MKDITRYILARTKERSTWMGIISIVTAVGMALTPDQTEAVISTGIALAGLIAVFTKDPGSKK